MRWSALKKLVENVLVPEPAVQIHCTSFRRERGGAHGRYWLTLEGKTLWAVPENMEQVMSSGASDQSTSTITGLIRRYLDTPREELLPVAVAGDPWGITQILFVLDRRVGKRTLERAPIADFHPVAAALRKLRRN